jgi:hypothetical protein
MTIWTGMAWPWTPQSITGVHHAQPFYALQEGQPLKRLYIRFRSGPACISLLHFWTPHAVHLWDGVQVDIIPEKISELTWKSDSSPSINMPTEWLASAHLDWRGTATHGLKVHPWVYGRGWSWTPQRWHAQSVDRD